MRKKDKLLMLLLSGCFLAASCGKDAGVDETLTPGTESTPTAGTEQGTETAPTAAPTEEGTAAPAVPVVTLPPVTFEAEEGVLSGNTKVQSSQKGFSGTGYVSGFEAENDSCTITIKVEQDGFYDLIFLASSSGGGKENTVFLDGEQIGSMLTTATAFEECPIERVYMTEGNHEVSVVKNWGWISLDAVTMIGSEALPADLYNVSAELINPNATENTKRLMKYLTDIYGEKILSGQFADGGMYGMERAAIWKATGEYPAVLGLDLIECSPSRVERGSTSYATKYAIEYWNEGGIVTLTWHWNAPSKYITGTWYRAFYTDSTNIDLAKIMNGEDEEGYELLVSDIDAIAEELKQLQDAGVPVIWRPLHEASGGWFWWGAAGADAYRELYIMMYDRLTNYHGLNNLIWLWNGQSADWYPGDEYVDIIGEDIYPGERVYTSQVKKFLEAASYSKERKMVVLSENGCLFDPELAVRDGAMWGFFATWSGEFVLKNANLNKLSEQYTEEAMLKKVYASDVVISFQDLPDLKNYPLD